jgi:hypothetical protein
MSLVRSSWDKELTIYDWIIDDWQSSICNESIVNGCYRFLCPLAMWRTLRFWEPRATPAARLALGAAFLRAARFSFLRSTGSVVVFVFILVFSILRTFP